MQHFALPLLKGVRKAAGTNRRFDGEQSFALYAKATTSRFVRVQIFLHLLINRSKQSLTSYLCTCPCPEGGTNLRFVRRGLQIYATASPKVMHRHAHALWARGTNRRFVRDADIFDLPDLHQGEYKAKLCI